MIRRATASRGTFAHAPELNAERREADLRAMSEQGVDVLVIGGGITGAGVALDAATRGYRVGLVDKADFASGTSSWSTKLVHGGIRYLPEGDVPLVREALVERGRLLANAPHLVHPLAFVLPLYAYSRHPVGLPIAPPGGIGLRWILGAGLTLYDMLAGSHNVARHRHLGADEVLRRARALRPEQLRSGFLYYDAQTDDTRLTLSVLRTASAAGAALANYAEVVGFDRAPSGSLRAAHVRLRAPGDGGRECVIPARYMVNATGVYAEEVERLTGEAPQLDVEPSKGVHLVVRREALEIGDDAVVLPETADRRIIFLVPWRSRVIVGTTDTGSGDLDTPRAGVDDVDYLLGHLNRSIRQPIARDDVLGTYAGYRPLLRLRHARTPARLSRTHAVVRGTSGMISVSGGKLTTYRVMARDAVDRIDALEGGARHCVTADLRLTGAEGWPDAASGLAARGARLGIDPETLKHLFASLGSLSTSVLDLVERDASLAERLDADLPAIRAEVVYAARAEAALTVGDALARRLRLDIEAADHGTAAAPVATDLLAAELGWDDERRHQELLGYAAYAEQRSAGLRPPNRTSPGASNAPSPRRKPEAASRGTPDVVAEESFG